MTALTRRRDRHRADCWRIYFGDVHVGDIGPRVGVPTNVDQWEWYYGFDPPACRGLKAGGTALDFANARQKFEAAWRELSMQGVFPDYPAPVVRNAGAAASWSTRKPSNPSRMAGSMSRSSTARSYSATKARRRNIAGLKFAIERGWLVMHDSGTFVTFTVRRR